MFDRSTGPLSFGFTSLENAILTPGNSKFFSNPVADLASSITTPASLSQPNALQSEMVSVCFPSQNSLEHVDNLSLIRTCIRRMNWKCLVTFPATNRTGRHLPIRVIHFNSVIFRIKCICYKCVFCQCRRCLVFARWQQRL